MLKIAVCRRDDAHIDVQGLHATEPFEFAVLQDSQELRLQLQRQFANLVEEKRSFVGEFNAANFPADGAGEGALFMAKELAFKQA